MAFQLVTFLAVLVCASATPLPLNHVLPHPYAIGGPSIHPGYPIQSGLIANHVLGAGPLSIGHGVVPLPEGKTTVTKTFISAPTYATSHVSERLHTEEPVYHGGNFVNQPLYAPLSYGGPIVSPIAYGPKYGW